MTLNHLQFIIFNTMKKLLLVLLFVPLTSCFKGDGNSNSNECKENENIKEIACTNGL